MVLFNLLRIIPSDEALQAAREAGANLTLPLAEALEEVYQKLAPHKAAYKYGLVSLCVEMSRRLGPVKFGCWDEENNTITSVSNCHYVALTIALTTPGSRKGLSVRPQ